MDLLSIDSLTDEQIRGILDEGQRWFADNRSTAIRDERLRGKIAVNLF